MQSCTVSVHAQLHSERILFGTSFRVGDRNFTITSIEGSSGKFWEETSSMDGVWNSKSKFGLERLMAWGKAEEGKLLTGIGNSVDFGFLRKQHKQLGDGEKDFLIREHAGQNSLFQSSKYCEGTVLFFFYMGGKCRLNEAFAFEEWSRIWKAFFQKRHTYNS